MQSRARTQSDPSESFPSGRQMVVKRGGRLTLRWLLAAVGYALLAVAWVFASPLGAAPDETAHAVRAAAASIGHWQGQPTLPYRRTPALTSAQAEFLNAESQQFTIPARLAPPDPSCFASSVDQSAACAGQQLPARTSGTTSVASYETNAPPGAYVVAGVPMRLPQQLVPPGYLGRLALALICVLLLAAAAWVAGSRGAVWPLAGLALAVTPTVLFLGASLGPQGVTLAAAICFATTLCAFWLGPPRPALGPLLAVSGAVLALSSAGGPVYLAALVVLTLPLVLPGRLVIPLSSLLSILVVAAALVGGTAWVLDHRLLPAGHTDVLGALPAVLDATPALLRQAIGVLGWADVTLPAAVYVAWGALVLLGVATAFVLGRWRDRLALLLVPGAALAVAAVAQALVLAPVSWDLQGRYLVPVLAALPILAGFVLQRAKLFPRADAFVLGLAVIALQLVAFWENARRYAVGQHGPLYFLDSAQWAPPAGWLPWLIVAAAGGLLLAASLVPLTKAERSEEAYGPLVVVDPISVSR